MKRFILKKFMFFLCIATIINCFSFGAIAENKKMTSAKTLSKTVITAEMPLSVQLPKYLCVNYKISKKGNTQIKILNAKKQLVYVSESKNVVENKNILLRWDCTASSGNKAGLAPGKIVTAGKYYLEISSGGTVITKTFELMPQPALSDREQEEMNYAVSSGIVPKELQGVYYRDVTEKEFCTLLYYACKRAGGKINTKWSDLFKKASSTKIIDRNTAAVILYDAAKEILGIKECNGRHFYFDPTFKDMGNNTFDWQHYDQIFFVTSQYDITSTSPLMRTDKYGYFNGLRKMNVLEAVQSCYRLSNSIMPEVSYVDMGLLGKMQLSQEQIQRALTMPVATPQKLPAWSGLTLMNLNTDTSEIGAKPNYYGTIMFAEQDVKNVADFGFNFVRVPIFYTAMISPSNKEQFNTAVIKSIDNLISYGIKYKVHICIDMHTLPGFVNCGMPEFDKNDLFSNEASQESACRLYSALARRYADVPSNVLSFNLLNEPRKSTELTDEEYSGVMEKIIAAIRKEDPDRLIIVDGLPSKVDGSSAGSPSQCLAASNVAQSKHFYWPGTFIYDYACNMGGYALQGWPLPFANCAVSSNNKPFTIQGDFVANTDITVNVDVFGGEGDLVVKADGAEVFRKTVANHKEGVNGCLSVMQSASIKDTSARYKFAEKINVGKPFKKIEISWEGQQANFIFLKTVVIEQPKPAKKPTPYYYAITDTKGGVKYYSNNTVTNILCAPPSNEVCALPASTILVDSDGIYSNPEQKQYEWDINYIRNNIKEWVDFSKQNNVAIMVQEFGCFSNFPNEMRLAYMNDLLTVLNENDIPWSMCGYWGPIGIFNSMRPDTDYEYYEPYYLDRQLLTLLQKYQTKN